MYNDTYIVALTSGTYVYSQSKPYRQKAAAIREFKRMEREKPPGIEIRILKAQWVDAGLDVK